MFSSKYNLILVALIGSAIAQSIPELALDFLPPFTSNDVKTPPNSVIAPAPAPVQKPISAAPGPIQKSVPAAPRPLSQHPIVAAAAPIPVQSEDAGAIVLKQIQNIELDGNYLYEYETNNGIHVEEQGSPKTTDSGEQAELVSGSYSYTAPDGQVITVTYTADENGFHPNGDHLPTPPPIPEAIIKALQYIESKRGLQ